MKKKYAIISGLLMTSLVTATSVAMIISTVKYKNKTNELSNEIKIHSLIKEFMHLKNQYVSWKEYEKPIADIDEVIKTKKYENLEKLLNQWKNQIKQDLITTKKDKETETKKEDVSENTDAKETNKEKEIENKPDASQPEEDTNPKSDATPPQNQGDGTNSEVSQPKETGDSNPSQNADEPKSDATPPTSNEPQENPTDASHNDQSTENISNPPREDVPPTTSQPNPQNEPTSNEETPQSQPDGTSIIHKS